MNQDNILDFDDETTAFVAHIFPQSEQVDAIAALLDENNIPHEVDRMVKQQGEIIPINPQLKLHQSDFQIKVPKNRIPQVDKLMNEHPELVLDEDAVRKLFLANSLDEQGWIDILLFPEEWMDRDEDFAKELLASKNIHIDPASYNERRKKRSAERQNENSYTQKNTLLQTIGIILIVISGIAWVVFGIGL